VSAVAHALVLAGLLWMPTPKSPPLAGVVTVDLVALAAPAAGGAGSRAPAPRAAETKPVPPAPKPAAAKPVPAPVEAKPEPPKPEPPKPEPPKPAPPTPPRSEAVIPKQPEREPEKPKVKPEPKPEPPEPPKEIAKAPPPKPSPAKPSPPQAAPPKPAPPKPTPPKQESYDDLLADLRAERGEARPDRVERPTRTASAAAGAGGATGAAAGGRPGAAANPEIAGWVRAVQLHVGRAWMLPPDMRGRRLMTELLVDLDGQGKVLSEPRVVRSSGDTRFDESAVRAIQKASPLPAPPDPGVWTIGFCPECRS